MHDGPTQGDKNFQFSKMVNLHNNNLSNQLGNLCKILTSCRL